MENKDNIFQNNINYKKIFLKFLTYKRMYIFFISVLIIIAFLINKFSTIYYENKALVLISEDNNNTVLGGQGDLFQNLNMFSGKNNIENEIEVLKSFSLIKSVINNLDLKASIFYYKNTTFSDLLSNSFFQKKFELYNTSPINIKIDPSFPQANYLKFYIEFLSNEEFSLKVEGTDIYLYNYIDDDVIDKISNIYFEKKYKFGDEIKTKYFNFIISKTEYYDKSFTDNNILYFYFNNLNILTQESQSLLSAEPISETSSIIEISFRGNNYDKITDFLNNLETEFIERNLDKKNDIALSTVDFIDSQIETIADSLSTAEATLKTFRTAKGVMDLSFQGQQIFEKLSELESEKALLFVQKKNYQYLSDYFKSNTQESDMPSPSSMNVVDPILTNLISEMIKLNGERASLVKNNNNSQNIYLQDLNNQITNLKNTIRENVNNSLNTLTISLNEINYRINSLSGQISQMPKTELQLKGIERKFELNDAIYTFLLQKRAEAQITRASSRPDYEIIETAKPFNYSVVSPKKKLNYIIALLLGLFIPTSYILIIDFFNNKISEIEDVQELTDRPILGKIYHNFRRTSLVVAEKPNSSISESFRAIRTNLQFFNDGGKNQVILITSSLSGEGKSFCSINLASVLALNGHRVIILEFDLRRPKIHPEFNASNMIGISSYLIEKAIIEDIIVPTSVENLDLICAGPAAPNPAELINSQRTAEFIDKLKEMYDYIVIDSAPVGIISETFLLMRHSNINIFVTRLNYTVKEALKNSLRNLKANKFENFSILINDLNIRKESYKYGYDNKYYSDEANKGFFRRIFPRKK